MENVLRIFIALTIPAPIRNEIKQIIEGLRQTTWGFPPQTRSFVPHVTIGRIIHKKAQSMLELPSQLSLATTEFIVDTIAFLHTKLIDNKPTYSVMKKIAFEQSTWHAEKK